MAYGLVPVSFGGHDLQLEGVYSSDFPQDDSGTFDTPNAEMVETPRPGQTPLHAFVQPDGIRLVLEMTLELLPETFEDGPQGAQEAMDRLKSWFRPRVGQQWLVATGETGNRRILCAPEKMAATENNVILRVSLRAADGYWEDIDETTQEETITTDGQLFEIENAGSDITYPTFVITPNTLKDSSNDYVTRRRAIIASRTKIGPLDDPEGDGYPVEISGGVLTAPGDETRLIIKGSEYNRWPSGNKLWANLGYQVAKSVTLSADLDDSSTDDITVLEETDAESWPDQGFIVWNDTGEVIQYESLGDQSFGTITRGAIGSTATAHTAGESGYFVEHGAWVDIISGIDAPTDPPAPDAKEPCLDLDASTNTLQVWPELHINLDSESRSRAFQRGYTEENVSSQHIRSYNDSGNALLEDTLPAAGKPRGNDLTMNFPVPIKADNNVVSLDMEVNPTLLLRIFAMDMEGNESKLLKQYYTLPVTGKQLSSSDLLTELRINGKVGAIAGDLSTLPLTTDPVPGSTVTVDLDDYFPPTDNPSTVTTPSGNVVSAVGVGGGGQSVNITLKTYFRFAIEAPTSKDGFMVYNATGTSGQIDIYTDEGGNPGDVIASVAISSGAVGPAIFVYQPPFPPLGLPAGVYHAKITGFGGVIGVHTERTEPEQYVEFHTNEADIMQALSSYPLTDAIVSGVESIRALHDNVFERSPFFGVMAEDAEPQSDAPLQTGNQIILSNLSATLDETRAPYIAIGDEEDLYLLQATITNQTTGQAFTLFHPMSLSQTLTIDSENRRVIDGETGLDVPSAFSGDWPYLAPGTNEFFYSEAGVVNTTVGVAYRNRYL